MVIVQNVGKLKEIAFVRICMLFCILGSENIRGRIREHEKVEDLPLWKEEKEDNENKE